MLRSRAPSLLAPNRKLTSAPRLPFRRPAKFPAIHHLTLFFPSNQGEDTTRVSFVGFKGEYSPLTRDPIITVYETQVRSYNPHVASHYFSRQALKPLCFVFAGKSGRPQQDPGDGHDEPQQDRVTGGSLHSCKKKSLTQETERHGESIVSVPPSAFPSGVHASRVAPDPEGTKYGHS